MRFCITFALLALTKFTLTAVLIAQFTSPHRLTQAGEGKLTSSQCTLNKITGTRLSQTYLFKREIDDPATVLVPQPNQTCPHLV